DRGCHGGRIAGWHKERRAFVTNDERHAARIRAHHWYAARHRLEHRIGHVVDPARVQGDRSGPVELAHRRVVQLPAEMDALGHAEPRRELYHRLALGAGPRYRHPRVGDAVAYQCESAQRRTDVINRIEIARHDQVGIRRARRFGRMETLEVNDVRNYRRREAVDGEHLLEEAGGHGQRGRSVECPGYQTAGTPQEALGIATAVIHDNWNAAYARNPYRGRGKQMPRPSGIRHDVEDFDFARDNPEASQERQQPE